MNASSLAYFCLSLLLVSGVPGCTRHPQVTVRNNAGIKITNVVISGTGFSEKLGDIVPGGSERSAARPTAESGLRLAFDANGTRHNLPEDGYLEASPHYRVTASVAADFSVKVESSIKP
jgi:hypothetical protein